MRKSCIFAVEYFHQQLLFYTTQLHSYHLKSQRSVIHYQVFIGLSSMNTASLYKEWGIFNKYVLGERLYQQMNTWMENPVNWSRYLYLGVFFLGKWDREKQSWRTVIIDHTV